MMVTIEADDKYTQLVRFDIARDKQSALIAAIVGQVDTWVCRLPGFISSTLHASLDGEHVINYAQWKDEASFHGFLHDPRNQQLQSAIHAVDAGAKPHAIHCRVVRGIEAPSPGQ